MRRFPWVTVGTVAACAAASSLSGGGDLLQYDRVRVAGGEAWRLLTGQMVHWTARMAVADLAVLLVLGLWLEIGGRRRALLLALSLGTTLVAAGIQLLLPGLSLYRGSSGLASALFLLTALEAAGPPSRRSTRALAFCAFLLFAAKAVWETAGGRPVFAGALATGVEVTPLVHLLGSLAGAAAFVLSRKLSSDPHPRRT